MAQDKPTKPKRRFVSPSVCQRRQVQTKGLEGGGIVNAALRDLDRAATPWPMAMAAAARVPTLRDDLCAAYRREASGSELMRAGLVRTADHALLIVKAGDLVIETAQGPFTLRPGDSVFVPAGWWRLSEMPPSPQGAVRLWILFFSPALIQTVIGESAAFQQAAEMVDPVFSGVYIQRGLLLALKARGWDEPLPDVERTFRMIAALAGASFFMFLRQHYYAARDELGRLARIALDSRCPVNEIGLGWPGGVAAFRRKFKLYHGSGVQTWLQRTKKTSPAGEAGKAHLS